jgi:hypothetical protein
VTGPVTNGCYHSCPKDALFGSSNAVFFSQMGLVDAGERWRYNKIIYFSIENGLVVSRKRNQI